MYLNNTLFRTAQLWPGMIAFDTDRRQTNWRDALARARRLAGSLATLAPGRGDRIALLGLNSAEYVELTFAAPLAGRPLMTLNYRLSFEELLHTLTECPCAVLCFDAANAPMAGRLRAHIGAAFVYWGDNVTRPGFAHAFESLVTAGEPCEPPVMSSEDVWAVIPSGGTTGRPKAIELSHRAMAFTVASTLTLLDLGSEPRGLHVAPLFHLAGFTASYALTANGGTHAFLPSFTVDGLLDRLASHRSTLTNLVPTMIAWLVARDDLDRYDLSALRSITYGASSISLATLRRLMTLLPGIELTQFYGQTEACGALTCLVARDHAPDGTTPHRLKSAGRPLPGVRLEILDDGGTALPRGRPGEICARTDAMFSRYVGHETQTAAASREGWLRTGDVGFLDDDGYLYVTDRLKDMIVTGGENVSASEVENVLARHPGVVQVAVVAAPDEIWGERVHAYVVRAPGAAVSDADLDRLCRGSLAAYKIPRGFTLQSEALPLSGAGKVRKDILRQMLKPAAASL